MLKPYYVRNQFYAIEQELKRKQQEMEKTTATIQELELQNLKDQACIDGLNAALQVLQETQGGQTDEQVAP